MQDIISHNIRTFLGTPGLDLDDKQGLTALALTKLMSSFTGVNALAIDNRRKPLTQHKRELIGSRLSQAIFQSSCLIHLLDLGEDTYDTEGLTELSDTFEEEYLQDSILCASKSLGVLVDMMEDIFHPLEEEEGDPEELTQTLAGYLAEVLASVVVLCERFDLDLEIVLANSKLLDKL